MFANDVLGPDQVAGSEKRAWSTLGRFLACFGSRRLPRNSALTLKRLIELPKSERRFICGTNAPVEWRARRDLNP